MELTGTDYILDAGELLTEAPAKSWIEAGLDHGVPDTSASTFAELEADAAMGGPGSDAEVTLGAIRTVISEVVADAEAVFEGYARAYYALPLAPLDPAAASWIKRFAWLRMQARKDFVTEADLNSRIRELRIEAGELAGMPARMVSVLLESEAGGESVAAYGTAERRLSRETLRGF